MCFFVVIQSEFQASSLVSPVSSVACHLNAYSSLIGQSHTKRGGGRSTRTDPKYFTVEKRFHSLSELVFTVNVEKQS